jgi:hypothetical protein
MLRDMGTHEDIIHRIRRERQLITRLQLATTQLADTERERIWAIVAAHKAGLSIRKIAAATGLSASRVHQLLQADEAHQIPMWLNRLRARDVPADDGATVDQPSGQLPLQARVMDEIEVLRWCIGWLEQLERGDEVVVNLRLDTEEDTEFVLFDRPRVLRVLARIAADLDELSRSPLATATATGEAEENSHARHRRRLSEPESTPRRLSIQEERAALRQSLGLPPYTRR